MKNFCYLVFKPAYAVHSPVMACLSNYTLDMDSRCCHHLFSAAENNCAIWPAQLSPMGPTVAQSYWLAADGVACAAGIMDFDLALLPQHQQSRLGDDWPVQFSLFTPQFNFPFPH